MCQADSEPIRQERRQELEVSLRWFYIRALVDSLGENSEVAHLIGAAHLGPPHIPRVFICLGALHAGKGLGHQNPQALFASASWNMLSPS
jgi:hypothetical protein